MYDQFYGFTARPFQLAPDPHFYFESATHRKAMSYLGYGLAQGEGMIIVTGEAGVGKTMLVSHLLDGINPAEVQAITLVAPASGVGDVLILAAEKLGLDYQGEEQSDLLRGLEIHLRTQMRAGRRSLLIVDDAQNLSLSAMEQLLALATLSLGAQPLIQIFLLGHPEFRQRLLSSPSLDALHQRVIASHHLDAMDAEEVEPYIFHRLSKAGWKGNPSISADAFDKCFAHSAGVPRKINSLFSRLLLHGALEELPRISGDTVDRVAQELLGQASGDAAERGEAARRSADVTNESPAMVATAEYVALQHRVAKLETRVAEQDEALRRIIDLLIMWVDQQDEDSAEAAKNAPTARHAPDFASA